MNQARGIIYLADPTDTPPRMQCGGDETMLVFNEAEPYLTQAQTALWRMRKRCEWVCVAAAGAASGIALALAAQLPVDRVALMKSAVFARKPAGYDRQLLRLDRFARRNLALVASEVVMIEPSDAELRGILSVLGRSNVAVLRAQQGVQEPFGASAEILRSTWDSVCENCLLISGKCV